MAEKMEPVALLDWMNAGLARLARCVDEHDGIIIKYMGDSIMAVFGAPLPRGSQAEVARDAQSAVRCAVAMQAELEDQNRRWGAEGLPQIAMRIGIHTGPVVAGCIGSAARLEFTVTGDTVNTASHLENARKEQILPPPGRCCRILVGEATHELLDGLFAGEFVGEERLKGKATNIKVYRIIGGQVAGNGESSSNTPL
jgi:class 3 adenylate cyclase